MPAGQNAHFVGMTTIDIVQVAHEHPHKNQKGWAHHAYLDVGGPAANAAITASILGTPAALHSEFGDAAMGGLVDGLFEPYGIERLDYGDRGEVPVSSIWVADATGDRTLLSTAASFDGPQPEVVDLNNARAVLLDGFYADLARAAARTAAQKEIPLVLDCGTWRDVFVDLLAAASVAIVSSQFDLPGHPAASAEDIAISLVLENGLRFAAVTRGGDSIVWATDSEKGELAVPEVEAIDTLGAGDVLHGAFMHFAFTRGFGDLEALELAATVASRSCAEFGVRAGVAAWAKET